MVTKQKQLDVIICSNHDASEQRAKLSSSEKAIKLSFSLALLKRYETLDPCKLAAVNTSETSKVS